jgi:murein L,D-transpeptidase YafK
VFRILLIAVAVAVLVFALVSEDVFAKRRKALGPHARADLVVIEKSAHRLTLYAHGRVLRTYVVSLGTGGMAPKSKAGDDLTPEGRYEIDRHDAQGDFYRALRISYPSAMDRKVAHARGVAPGGGIAIEGIRNHLGWLGGWQRAVDWTNGSVALTDGEMDELWRTVPNGTPVEIRH